VVDDIKASAADWRGPTPRTAEELLAHLASINAKKVKVAVTDIDGVLRGKYLHIDKLRSALTSDMGFCSVVLGWDVGDVTYDNATYTGWHTGYPDTLVTLDPTTYRAVPWDDNVPFVLGDFTATDGQPLAVCPRNTLKRVIKRLGDAGFIAAIGVEYEWFNFRETAHSLAAKRYVGPDPLTPGMFGYSLVRMNQNRGFVNAIFDDMTAFGVPIEGLHTETGPGVFEAAILFSHALEAADRATLFKTSVKEIGQRFGIMPTFMAKWNPELPGCSGHIHQSIWDPDAKSNLFYDASRPNGMSALFESWIAGQIALMPELCALYAPTINSYKRLVEGAWAPTRANWGIDNRTVALRVIAGSSKSTRLETRVNGSDSNAYLAVAAALASGLHGVQRGLTLDALPIVGNGYADTIATALPADLNQATERLARSEAARELLGDAFVEHFVATRRWEWRQFARAVTDWETARYFEVI